MESPLTREWGIVRSAWVMLGIGTRPVFDVENPTLFEGMTHAY